MKSEYFSGIDYRQPLRQAYDVAGHRVEVFEDAEDARPTLWVRIRIDDDKSWATKLLCGSGGSLERQLWTLHQQVDVIADTVAHFKGWGSPEYERIHALSRGLNTWRFCTWYGVDDIPDDIGPPVHKLIEEAA